MAYQDEIFIPIRMVNKNVIVIIASLKFIELFMDNRVQVRIIDIIIILDVILKFFSLGILRVIHM